MTAVPNHQIVIGTGLPRSGTSMMMKMLEAGGVPALCDGQRAADRDNPNGYYEFEAVKKTRQDSRWLQQAMGKAVKMVYSLLYDLPAGRQYKVIFMRRDLSEILASQNQMLKNMNLSSRVDDARMATLFDAEITRFRKWIVTSKQIDFVEVPYNDIASGNLIPLKQINSHLGGRLNTAAMAAVVDSSLYRNRAA